MFSSICVMLNLMMVLFVRSNPTPLVPFADANKNKDKNKNGAQIVIPTNQGIFASSESLVEVQAKAKNFTAAEMIKRTGRDGSILLENAWLRVAGDDHNDHIYHISLLMKFADEKCERMEFYPDNGPGDVLGEHPHGRAILSPDTASAACNNAVSFLGIPKTGGVLGLTHLLTKMSTKKTGDFLRWTTADGKINRSELYSAFIQEAARFKDELKYTCGSFANNVIQDASNDKYVDRSTLISLIQAASGTGDVCSCDCGKDDPIRC